MNEDAPDSASVYSAEGTAYHGVAERAYRSGAPCAAEVGQRIEADGFKFTVNDEDADYAQQYVDRLRERAAAGCLVFIEQKADTSDVLGIPDQSGTIDGLVLDIINETIEVDDLKFGRGVKVEVWKDPGEGVPRWQGINDQLGTYGRAAWLRYAFMCKWKWLRLAIHQPRLNHYAEIVLSRAEVEAWAEGLYIDAQQSYGVWKAYRNDATHLGNHLTPSLDACRWCFRAGSCRVRAESILRQFLTPDQLKYATEYPVTAKNLPTLSGPELAKALDRIEEIENWCRAVRAEALGRAESGSKDAAPGWKLVEGRKGDRTADPEAMAIKAREALDALAGEVDPKRPLPKELYTEPQLKSVAQIQGACKKLGAVGKAIWDAITGNPEKGIPSLITQAPGRNTLVRDFDARPELAPQPVTFELRPVDQEFKQDAAAGLL